eukprot:8845793-Lingulodinium_polyedra.AAC.1
MVLYPAHIDLPTDRAAKSLEHLYARAARTADWAPRFVAGAITARWGIRRAPWRPTAAARAAAATAALSG